MAIEIATKYWQFFPLFSGDKRQQGRVAVEITYDDRVGIFHGKHQLEAGISVIEDWAFTAVPHPITTAPIGSPVT